MKYFIQFPIFLIIFLHDISRFCLNKRLYLRNKRL